jgi:hypothetical protein
MKHQTLFFIVQFFKLYIYMQLTLQPHLNKNLYKLLQKVPKLKNLYSFLSFPHFQISKLKSNQVRKTPTILQNPLDQKSTLFGTPNAHSVENVRNHGCKLNQGPDSNWPFLVGTDPESSRLPVLE